MGLRQGGGGICPSCGDRSRRVAAGTTARWPIVPLPASRWYCGCGYADSSAIAKTLEKTRSKLDSVNPNDQQAVAAAVQETSKDLGGLSAMRNPLDQPNLRSQDLEAAAAQLPKCQQVKDAIAGSVSSRTSAPPPTS
jgi:hypothetical protein